MSFHRVPQPSPQRMVPVAGHPLVVGITPGQSELVALTAAAWADALGSVPIYFGFVDQTRIVDEEYADGTVRHSELDPDLADDSWQLREAQIQQFLTEALSEHKGPWEFRYLAGRPDRALTHLARAVDAAAIVVGARAPGPGARLREAVGGSVAVHLSHHQHRPVLVVPLSVVDWKTPLFR